MIDPLCLGLTWCLLPLSPSSLRCPYSLAAPPHTHTHRVGHHVGALLCVAGVSLLLLTDSGSSTGGPRPLLGDGLVLAGAIVYALSNVMEERLLVGVGVEGGEGGGGGLRVGG